MSEPKKTFIRSESEETPYKSMYMEGYVSTPQYIAELVFKKREAFYEANLPENFWNLKKYQAQYRWQITEANSLLRKYHEKAIIEALKEIKHCISLTNPKLLALIKKKQVLVESIEKKRVIKMSEEDTKKPSQAFSTHKNIMDEL